MIWADRVAAVAAFLYFLFVFICFGGFAPDRYIRAQLLTNYFLVWGVPTLVGWIFLRIVDLAIGGRGRRAGRFTYRRL